MSDLPQWYTHFKNQSIFTRLPKECENQGFLEADVIGDTGRPSNWYLIDSSDSRMWYLYYITDLPYRERDGHLGYDRIVMIPDGCEAYHLVRSSRFLSKYVTGEEYVVQIPEGIIAPPDVAWEYIPRSPNRIRFPAKNSRLEVLNTWPMDVYWYAYSGKSYFEAIVPDGQTRTLSVRDRLSGIFRTGHFIAPKEEGSSGALTIQWDPKLETLSEEPVYTLSENRLNSLKTDLVETLYRRFLVDYHLTKSSNKKENES